MARPKKSPETKRHAVAKCQLIPSDKLRMDQLALDEGLSISDLIKLRVLGTEPKRRKATPDRATLIRGLADLGRIGSNINQIARALNSSPNAAWDIPPEVISNALYDISQLSKRIINNLDSGH